MINMDNELKVKSTRMKIKFIITYYHIVFYHFMAILGSFKGISAQFALSFLIPPGGFTCGIFVVGICCVVFVEAKQDFEAQIVLKYH